MRIKHLTIKLMQKKFHNWNHQIKPFILVIISIWTIMFKTALLVKGRSVETYQQEFMFFLLILVHSIENI